MLIEGETSLKVCIRKETWTVKFIVCPKLACDVIPGADFLPCTKALQNLAQGTFSTQRATGANADTLLPNDDADDICIAFFEAAAVLMNDLDDPCALLLLKYANIFSWQGARLRRTNIVKQTINTRKARPIWQPPRCILPPRRGDVNHPVVEMLRDEITKLSKSPWVPPIASVKKNDGRLQLCVDYRKLNAITKINAFILSHINVSLGSLHGSQWFCTLNLNSGCWQVQVAEADREKTVFLLPNGLYEFLNDALWTVQRGGHLPKPHANSSDWPIPKALHYPS
ncbi:histone H2A [Echinococcus multilocularis]|uniref:Histone H2A n=1 Tax=Echinococcus multilocularis TaxID=6211 RepID=A0A068Y154_ECHMU|nr:histone H2A [Echinococcus multilocularis]